MTADIYAEDGYFAIVPEWILDADISAQAVRLYAVLRRYSDQAAKFAHPSRKILAERLHVSSVRTVDAAVAELVKVGAVTTFPRTTTDGDRTSNGYILNRQPLHEVVQEIARGVGAETAQQKNESQLEREKNTPPTPSSSIRDVEDPDFVEFWKTYPHRPKDPKTPARKAWKTARKLADVEMIMNGLKGCDFSTDPQFRPMASTWLNQRRWEDGVEAETPDARRARQRAFWNRNPWE